MAKALDSPLEKLDSPHDTLGWVGAYSQQTGQLYTRLHLPHKFGIVNFPLLLSPIVLLIPMFFLSLWNNTFML